MTTPTDRNLFDDPPNELCRALGQVCVHYGRIEHVLTATIHRTTSCSWDAAFEMAQDQLRPRKTMAAAVIDAFNKWADAKYTSADASAQKRRFAELMSEIKDLCDRRDDVIHCAWGKDSAGQIRVTRRGQALAYRDRTPVQPSDIFRLAEAMARCAKELNDATYYNSAPKPAPVGEGLVLLVPSGMAFTATAASYPPDDGQFIVWPWKPSGPN